MSAAFAAALRDPTSSGIPFTYPTYVRWRRVSSEACRLAGSIVPDLTLETTPLNARLKGKVETWGEKNGWGLEKISMHLLCEDTPEAALGLYEKYTLGYLDSKYATKPHPKAVFRQHPAWEGGKLWAPLYFRKHLVVAHDVGDGSVVVFNPAERDFCDGKPARLNERRRAFYERTWTLLAKKVFGDDKEVTVRHMGLQGTNDCGVWIYLIPHLMRRARDKKTALVRRPQVAFQKFVERMV